MKGAFSERWLLAFSIALILVMGVLAVKAFLIHQYLIAFGMLALASIGVVFAALLLVNIDFVSWICGDFYDDFDEDDDEAEEDDDLYESSSGLACVTLKKMEQKSEIGKPRAMVSVLLRGDPDPLQQSNVRQIVMTGGSDSPSASNRQPKRLFRFDLEGSFCVDSVQAVKELLAQALRAVLIAEAIGFVSFSAKVGGGVYEWDTGWLAFDACYQDFNMMMKRLPLDFQKAEAEKLDGYWFNRLNFGYMQVMLEQDGLELALVLSRGVLTTAVFDASPREEALLSELRSQLSQFWPLLADLEGLQPDMVTRNRRL